MLRPKLFLLALCSTAFVSVHAQSIPTPESMIGHKVGEPYKLATWESIVRYFDALDKASDRVVIRRIGKTSFGREMIVAEVSSAANIRNLKKLYSYQEKLHDPRKIRDTKEEEEILKNAKSTILVNCS